MSDMISVREAAELIGVTAGAVRIYVQSGRLGSDKVGRDYVLDRAEVERFAAARKLVKGEPVEA